MAQEHGLNPPQTIQTAKVEERRPYTPPGYRPHEGYNNLTPLQRVSAHGGLTIYPDQWQGHFPKSDAAKDLVTQVDQKLLASGELDSGNEWVEPNG
jgi:hypothetical protein